MNIIINNNIDLCLDYLLFHILKYVVSDIKLINVLYVQAGRKPKVDPSVVDKEVLKNKNEIFDGKSK